MNYTMSPTGRQNLTERFEGDILTAYPDPASGGAPWTIGYGHTGPDVYQGLVWTQGQADAALQADLAWAEAAVSREVTVPLSQNQADALIDFVFNEGETNFHQSTLLAKLNQGDYDGADAEFQKWDKAAGRFMQGLLNRREAEAADFNQPT